MAESLFCWQRFWVPRERQLVVTHGGFLPDPQTREGAGCNPDVIPFERIQDSPCLVLLGEPGIGKTVALEQHRDAAESTMRTDGAPLVWKPLQSYQSDILLVRSIFEDPVATEWVRGDGFLHLFLDSFDECLIRVDTLASLLAQELEKLPVARLRLRIVCRTAVWPGLLEEKLRKLWGPDHVSVYELAPLRMRDVTDAASSKGISPNCFLAEIERREAVPLAAKPVTLRFLLNIVQRGQELPATQAELYRQGCEQLCIETSKSRRAAGKLGQLSGRQRLAVAERIAAVAIFCARPTICTGLDAGELDPNETGIENLVGGEEFVDGEPVAVTAAAMREVLDTGLFAARGFERLGFAHQTYAEFLAAQYLSSHHMEPAQSLSLITSSVDGHTKVIPQLQETTAWLASLEPAIYEEVLQWDPQVLLGSDVTTMSSEAREALVGTLLYEFDKGVMVDNQWRRRLRLRKLTHRRLAAQLRPYIESREKNRVVRRLAIDIAEACELHTLENALLERVLDPTDDLHVREQAAAALFRIGDETTKRQLLPCVAGLAGDTQDELKGRALQSLWPTVLTVQEVFAALTPPKRRGIAGGTYQLFLSGQLLEHLPPTDLPVALRWVADQPARDDRGSPFKQVVDKLLCIAWEHIDTPGVLEPFATVVAYRLAHHRSVPRPKHANNSEGDRAKRHKLVDAVVPVLIQNNTDPAVLVFAERPLVDQNDFAWVISRLRPMSAGAGVTFWLKLVCAVYRSDNQAHLDILFDESKTSLPLRQAFAGLLMPVKLNSPEAQAMREDYERRQQWEEQFRRDEVILDPPPEQRISALLEQSEQGELNAWWQLNTELTVEPTSTHYGDELEPDLTSLPGWHAADAAVRGRLVEAAQRYLIHAQPAVNEWLGQNVMYRPDFAGYRAFRLLAHERPDLLDSLSRDIWQRWAQVIVGYPTSSGGPNEQPHQELTARAYRCASTQVIAAVLILIDQENRDNEWISIARKMIHCRDATLSHAFMKKVQDPDLKPSCMGSLLDILLAHGMAEAEDFAASFLAPPLPSDELARKRAIVAGSLLLVHAQDAGWEHIWPVIQADTEFGRSVILAVADRHDQQHAALLTHHLTEERIADLYLWVTQQFPHAADPHQDGAHFVGPREGVAHFRDSILRQLQARGTSLACRALERLMQQLPQLTWLRWSLADARELAFRRNWQPLQPAVLRRLVTDHALRLVDSGEQLLAVVQASLTRLERELQGETPAAPDLWNRLPGAVYEPKDEQHLSDYITRHLRRDLQQRGIVANREVEIRRGEGAAKGQRTDIYVDAITRGASQDQYHVITAVLEVKGCWNKGLKTDMRTQLRDGYLNETRSRHGLYVVGWFACPQWSNGDYRKQQTPKWTCEEAQRWFERQAVTLSEPDVSLEAMVLNASLR